MEHLLFKRIFTRKQQQVNRIITEWAHLPSKFHKVSILVKCKYLKTSTRCKPSSYLTHKQFNFWIIWLLKTIQHSVFHHIIIRLCTTQLIIILDNTIRLIITPVNTIRHKDMVLYRQIKVEVYWTEVNKDLVKDSCLKISNNFSTKHCNRQKLVSQCNCSLVINRLVTSKVNQLNEHKNWT